MPPRGIQLHLSRTEAQAIWNGLALYYERLASESAVLDPHSEVGLVAELLETIGLQLDPED
jgi:hypothetical protein